VDVVSSPHLVEIVAALKEITARVSSADGLSTAVTDIIKITGDLLPAGIICGVTLVAHGEPATFTATGLPSEILDEVRFADGDGPCMESVRTHDIVLCRDLQAEPRWPVWAAAARRHGLRAVLAYPFDVDPLTLGALGLYATRPEVLAAEAPLIAMLVADHASLLLRVRLRQLIQEETHAQVSEVPTDDVSVQRAVGIVMAQRGCTPEQAIRHLHEAATQLGVGLPAVAERLVHTVGNRGGITA
jgi:ANTAR domain/GAF domain